MQPGAPRRSTPKQVLIVEDNELNLKLLKEILEVRGYSTIATRNGVEAVSLARRHRPDVILLDIQLPDISGMDAARQLKDDERTRAIPLVAVTAFAMPGDRGMILESGCDDYVSKPINIHNFLALVERYTEDRLATVGTSNAPDQPTDRRIAKALRRAFDVAVFELRRHRVSEHEIQAWLARKRSQLAIGAVGSAG